MTSSLPEPFRAAFAGLEERLPIGQSDSRFHQCFGCGPGHPSGLHVRCFKTAEGVMSPIIIPGQYSGPPGAAHGGIVAAYLDEVLAAAVVRTAGRTAVTGELTVRYVKPVPVETPIVGKGLAGRRPWPLCGCRGTAGGTRQRHRAGNGAGPVLSHSVLKKTRARLFDRARYARAINR